MLSQNPTHDVKSDQTTLEVIDLAKFPGHDPGTALNTWFLASASRNTVLPPILSTEEHPNNIYNNIDAMLSLICWNIVEYVEQQSSCKIFFSTQRRFFRL